MGFAELGDGDEVEVLVNGRDLPWHDRQIPSQPWTVECYDGAWNLYPSRTKSVPLDFDPVEFTVGAGVLTRGVNRLNVRLVRRSEGVQSTGYRSLVLESVRICVHYS